MLGTSPTIRCPRRPHSQKSERRQARRMSLNRNVHLVARDVDGFVLDVSCTGARVALFTDGRELSGTVVLAIAGVAETRLAAVQWVRSCADGCIVGVEFVEDVHTQAEPPPEPALAADDDDLIFEETTQIRAVPVWSVTDVPGATRTLEENAVVVHRCIHLVA